MKALTISQPFASLIASGDKWIENRKWPTLYRGPLVIHAGKGLQYLDKNELADYPSGCIIAVALLTACVPLETIRTKGQSTERNKKISGGVRTWSEAHEHKHAEGPFCWILERVQNIPPYPMRGAQGLWDVRLSNLLSREQMGALADALQIAKGLVG